MDTPISRELIDFIRHQGALAPSGDIVASSGMQRDFGIYGDDAVEFLLAYAAAFKVDVSRFMAADYFAGEGLDLLAWFKPIKKYKELTVLHLQQGIAAGRLDETVIRGA